RLFHPNVNGEGGICLDILNDPTLWSPAIGLEKLLVSVASLLSEPRVEHGLNDEALALLRSEPEAFNKRARARARVGLAADAESEPTFPAVPAPGVPGPLPATAAGVLPGAAEGPQPPLKIGMHRMGSAGNGGIRKELGVDRAGEPPPTSRALDKGGDWQMGNDDDCSADKSPLWILNKAKNHIGYGFDGRVNPGEVQVSAVSGDTPDWFVGPRTFEGPFHCKSVPVRRCPDVHFRPDGKMLYTVKTYHQGGFLDTSEVHQVIDTKGRP
ncbi:hus5, partial [Symbiodinium necroappetens]